MTLIVALSASTSLLTHLVNPAARALAVGLVVALALAAFRRTTTSLRLFTWTAVLYSALAMPLLEWMLPPLPMPVPTFLQTAFIPHPEGAPSKLRLGGVFDRSQQKEVVVPNSARNAEEINPKPIQSSHAAAAHIETFSILPFRAYFIISRLDRLGHGRRRALSRRRLHSSAALLHRANLRPQA